MTFDAAADFIEEAGEILRVNQDMAPGERAAVLAGLAQAMALFEITRLLRPLAEIELDRAVKRVQEERRRGH